MVWHPEQHVHTSIHLQLSGSWIHTSSQKPRLKPRGAEIQAKPDIYALTTSHDLNGWSHMTKKNNINNTKNKQKIIPLRIYTEIPLGLTAWLTARMQSPFSVNDFTVRIDGGWALNDKCSLQFGGSCRHNVGYWGRFNQALVAITKVRRTIWMAFGSPNPHQGAGMIFLDARAESSDLLGYELISLSVKSKLSKITVLQQTNPKNLKHFSNVSLTPQVFQANLRSCSHHPDRIELSKCSFPPISESNCTPLSRPAWTR